MKIEQIRQLITELTEAGLSGAQIDQPGFKLSLKRGVAGQLDETANVTPESNVLQIKASGVGRLLHAHPDGGVVLAPVGSDIQIDQLVALLAVGNLLLPVRSQHAGQVASVLVPSGATVGYGQPLIGLSPYDSDAVQP